MRRLSLKLSLILFFLADWGLNVAADDTRMGQSDVMVPTDRIECSLHRSPLEPSDPSSTSAIPHVEKFVAREHFKEDVSSAADVKMSWLGATFMRRFMATVEEDGGFASFQTYVLSRLSSDKEIILQLGQGHESKLVDVWCLLRRQASGDAGALQTNSTPNIFFVRDTAGEVGVVDVVWGGVGWEIGASPVGDKRRWLPGTRAFSR